MQRKISIYDWCHKKKHEKYILEFDNSKNQGLRIYSPNVENIAYDYPFAVWWTCPSGHSYAMPVAMRILFGKDCPICDKNNELLSVGTINGCLEIIGIAIDKNVQYECRCKCGCVQKVDLFHFIKKKHRFCDAIYDESKHYFNGDECELRVVQEKNRMEKVPRKKASDYDIDYPYKIHESLELTGETYDKEEPYYYSNSKWYDKNRRVKGYTIHKMYRCRCYLCGKEYGFKYRNFLIKSDEYGVRASDGYYSEAFCKCHEISSFQWRTVDILQKHGIEYRVEVSFSDLLGINHIKELRFDFGIYKSDELVCLIECQGKQHYMGVDEFGGEEAYKVQQENDRLKREYAKKHNIRLVEISYKCNTYKKEEEYLIEQGVIS